MFGATNISLKSDESYQTFISCQENIILLLPAVWLQIWLIRYLNDFLATLKYTALPCFFSFFFIVFIVLIYITLIYIISFTCTGVTGPY